MSDESALLIDEGGRVRRVKLPPLPAVLGRDAGCDVVLDDASASRRHARLEATPLGCAIVDLESANGTTLDGRKIRRALLRRGAEIVVGATRIVYLGDDAVAAASDAADAEAPRLPTASVAPAAASKDAARPPASDAGDDPDAPPPPQPTGPPPSKATRRAANLVTLALLVLLNGAVLVVFNVYFRKDPPPKSPPPPAPPSGRSGDEGRAPPPNPEGLARADWSATEAEVARHVAADRFDDAFAALKEFVAAHGDTRFVERALERMNAVRATRDERVENCLLYAERMVELGDPEAAVRSVNLARTMAGPEPPARLEAVGTRAAAAVEAKRAGKK